MHLPHRRALRTASVRIDQLDQDGLDAYHYGFDSYWDELRYDLGLSEEEIDRLKGAERDELNGLLDGSLGADDVSDTVRGVVAGAKAGSKAGSKGTGIFSRLMSTFGLGGSGSSGSSGKKGRGQKRIGGGWDSTDSGGGGMQMDWEDGWGTRKAGAGAGGSASAPPLLDSCRRCAAFSATDFLPGDPDAKQLRGQDPEAADSGGLGGLAGIGQLLSHMHHYGGGEGAGMVAGAEAAEAAGGGGGGGAGGGGGGGNGGAGGPHPDVRRRYCRAVGGYVGEVPYDRGLREYHHRLVKYILSPEYRARAAAIAAQPPFTTPAASTESGTGTASEATASSTPNGAPAAPAGPNRGILIPAGGSRYLTNLIVTLHVIRRHFKCTLPIEVAWKGGTEMDDVTWSALERHFAPLRGFDVDSTPHPVEGLHDKIDMRSYTVKVYSILMSSFTQVLLLDADSLPLVDPATLFEDPRFVEHGSLFWPDAWTGAASHDAYRTYGMDPDKANAVLDMGRGTGRRDAESGQLLVDRGRHLDVLEMLLMVNRRPTANSGMLWGDKDTFSLAFALAGKAQCYNQVAVPPSAFLYWSPDKLLTKATNTAGPGWLLGGFVQNLEDTPYVYGTTQLVGRTAAGHDGKAAQHGGEKGKAQGVGKGKGKGTEQGGSVTVKRAEEAHAAVSPPPKATVQQGAGRAVADAALKHAGQGKGEQTAGSGEAAVGGAAGGVGHASGSKQGTGAAAGEGAAAGAKAGEGAASVSAASGGGQGGALAGGAAGAGGGGGRSGGDRQLLSAERQGSGDGPADGLSVVAAQGAAAGLGVQRGAESSGAQPGGSRHVLGAGASGQASDASSSAATSGSSSGGSSSGGSSAGSGGATAARSSPSASPPPPAPLLPLTGVTRPAFLHRTINKFRQGEEPHLLEVLTAPMTQSWATYFLAHENPGPTRGVPYDYCVPESALHIITTRPHLEWNVSERARLPLLTDQWIKHVKAGGWGLGLGGRRAGAAGAGDSVWERAWGTGNEPGEEQEVQVGWWGRLMGRGGGSAGSKAKGRAAGAGPPVAAKEVAPADWWRQPQCALVAPGAAGDAAGQGGACPREQADAYLMAIDSGLPLDRHPWLEAVCAEYLTAAAKAAAQRVAAAAEATAATAGAPLAGSAAAVNASLDSYDTGIQAYLYARDHGLLDVVPLPRSTAAPYAYLEDNHKRGGGLSASRAKPPPPPPRPSPPPGKSSAGGLMSEQELEEDFWKRLSELGDNLANRVPQPAPPPLPAVRHDWSSPWPCAEAPFIGAVRASYRGYAWVRQHGREFPMLRSGAKREQEKR